MAGHDDRQRVGADRLPDGARRPRPSDLLGDLPVGAGLGRKEYPAAPARPSRWKAVPCARSSSPASDVDIAARIATQLVRPVAGVVLRRRLRCAEETELLFGLSGGRRRESDGAKAALAEAEAYPAEVCLDDE